MHCFFHTYKTIALKCLLMALTLPPGFKPPEVAPTHAPPTTELTPVSKKNLTQNERLPAHICSPLTKITL